MFRATILPIIRSIRLYNAACGMKHPMSCRPVVWQRRNSTTRPPSPTGIRSPDCPAHSEVRFVLYLCLNKPTEMSLSDTDYRTSTVLASRLLLALGVSQQLQWPAVEEEPSAPSHGICPCHCYPTLTWEIA